jgi:hypothetical protein
VTQFFSPYNFTFIFLSSLFLNEKQETWLKQQHHYIVTQRAFPKSTLSLQDEIEIITNPEAF